MLGNLHKSHKAHYNDHSECQDRSIDLPLGCTKGGSKIVRQWHLGNVCGNLCVENKFHGKSTKIMLTGTFMLKGKMMGIMPCLVVGQILVPGS